MDFDDLEEVEAAFGPSPADMREELMSKQDPLAMPGACEHPRPSGRGFGGGPALKEKVLYLHGTGSNAKLGRNQVNAVFKNTSGFKNCEFDFWEGSINNKVEDIHADPAVAKLFVPYGNKCGETYDGYLSYMWLENESHNNETWVGPSHKGEVSSGQLGYEDVLDAMAEHLEKNGPYDGLCGFDMGAFLALDAARLAQEGDARFVNKFRYLVLLSACVHRELARFQQGSARPKAPLQIPTFLGWSDEDDSKQYSNYEAAALYIHPDYRGICKHDQGHRPPNLQKGTKQLEALEKFMSNMQADNSFVVPDTDDLPTYRNFWLPLLRDSGPSVPADAPKKLIIVEDPLGVHGPTPEESLKDRLRFPAQETPDVCAKRLDVYRMVTGITVADFTHILAETEGGSEVEVIGVEYQEEHQKLAWHPEVQARDVSMAYAAGQGRSRWLQAEDEITVPWVQIRFLAEELLEKIVISRDDAVTIVGLGTGAHVAFALAEAIMKIKSFVPTRLFTVCPPTVWPMEDVPPMGSLVNTPVRYMTCPQSVAGVPWRLETATLGPFSQSHFDSKESLLKLIADEVCSLAN